MAITGFAAYYSCTWTFRAKSLVASILRRVLPQLWGVYEMTPCWQAVVRPRKYVTSRLPLRCGRRWRSRDVVLVWLFSLNVRLRVRYMDSDIYVTFNPKDLGWRT